MPPLKTIYEDDTLLVVDKPAGIAIEQLPKLTELGEECRNGIVHRLDKDTSGILLIAKTKKAFEFFQKQFQDRNVEKKYVCLVVGTLKEKQGAIETLLGRAGNDRRKQKTFPITDLEKQGKRTAITAYRVLQQLKDQTGQQYTLLEATPKTGRKHQIRAHMAYLNHPIAGDKLYGFKNQPTPNELSRQFLHATFLKVPTPPDGKTQKQFISELSEDLQIVLKQLQQHDN